MFKIKFNRKIGDSKKYLFQLKSLCVPKLMSIKCYLGMIYNLGKHDIIVGNKQTTSTVKANINVLKMVVKS